MTKMYVMIEAGTPLVMNVLTVKYRLPTSSVILMAVTLGNPDVGKPMAPDASNAVPIIKSNGCG